MNQAELIKRIEKAARDWEASLNLSGEGISQLPEQIGQLVKLRTLDLRDNQLSTLPEQIGQLVKLETLHLNGNQLSTLPEQIGQLVNLLSLDVSSNKLRMLPGALGRLSNLHTLHLGRNQLGTLPKQIGKLANLQTLFLGQNQLSTLPDEIGGLTKLKVLDLSENQLRALPEQIGLLTQLETLGLDRNHLRQLPGSIGNLSRLTTLYLGIMTVQHGNPIIGLPVELRKLSQLTYLDVSNCPQLSLPPEIVTKRNSPHEILDYYFRAREQAARPLNEAKVLVVGEAEVGKTSLIKRLRGLDFDPDEDQTHGIVTHKWDLAVSGARKSPHPGPLPEGEGERTVRLNVWDFGGQEIMHATHQFFLTKRSLYLLVLDSRQNEAQSRIEYWLKLIQSFGEDSPVIVVCNKCDQQLMQLDWKGIQTKYPHIRRYVKAVSCANDAGLEDVRTAIEEEIGRLEHIDTVFPETWFNVKQRLEDMSESYMPYTDYTELCQQVEIKEETEQRQLIGFLHDLGIVLHFHDHPILRDLNILNPLWVTTAVYRILTSQHLTEARGVLTFDELGTLLEEVADKRFKYPPERQIFVIEMMRRFELLFDFEGQVNQKFLVPGLLPLEQPEDLEVPWYASLGFRYQYEVLPQSVISRFIVRMHQRIHEETYWRKGVVLESLDGDARARVQADFEDARIDIHIRGDRHGDRRFLQSIRDQFDAIHATIAKLTVEELVPLPEHPEVMVDYGRLLLFEKKGKPIDYEKVGGDLIEFNVNELLEGIRHPAGLDVFISYAHDNAVWLKRFNTMLSPLVRGGRITTWSDKDIAANQNWREEIDRALEMARCGLLLVSPEFLASDFIMNKELPYLLRAREEGRARIVFAVLGDCPWEETGLKEIQAAHDAGTPLDGLTVSKRNKSIKSICKQLMGEG